jgi:hypothetical protein
LHSSIGFSLGVLRDLFWLQSSLLLFGRWKLSAVGLPAYSRVRVNIPREMNARRDLMKSHLPLIGILASIGLFALSTRYYPGGTSDSADSIGYDWKHNFISTLFAPTALNGAANPARRLAIPAMFLFCASIGFLFKDISSKTKSRFHRKAIEICGIGTAIYAFLVITPMHDLLVSIALVFFVVAVLAILHLLYIGRQMRLFYTGIVCLISLLISAVMYYGHLLFGLLPIAQKLTFALSVFWLLALHYAEFNAERFPDRRLNRTDVRRQ